MSRLARQIGVKTPSINAMIHMTSVLMNRDYDREALRTPETLGIDGMSIAELGSL
jgi:opine dehydrogenase